MTDSSENSLGDFIGSEHIDVLSHPDLNAARGLPASVYTDSEFFTLEQKKLFPATWMGIGFESDVPQSGDAIPLEIMGLPMILCRDKSDRIQVLHNVCRHRATVVLETPEFGLKNFKCPYHGWVYDLDGGLLATPFWDGTSNAKTCPVEADSASLVKIRSEVWNHIVFINLDENAGELHNYLKELNQEFDHLDLDSMELAHTEEWEFDANWKLVMENWEVYHHVWVHEGIFDKMSYEVDMKTGEPFTDMIASNNCMMLRPNDLRPDGARPGNNGLPEMPKKREVVQHTSIANAVLPNVTASMGVVEFAPAVYVPMGAGKTLARMAWYLPPGVVGNKSMADGMQGILDKWLGADRTISGRKGIRAQDHRCMELQQLARSSPVANDVRFSKTWESNVRYFQEWLVGKIVRSRKITDRRSSYNDK